MQIEYEQPGVMKGILLAAADDERMKELTAAAAEIHWGNPINDEQGFLCIYTYVRWYELNG